MIRSIKRQIMALFSGIIVFMIVIMFIINGGFLERYYVSTKQSEFIEVYNLLESGMEEGTLSLETPSGELSQTAERNNIAVIVLNRQYEPLYMNARDMQMMVTQLMGYLYNKNTHEVLDYTDEYVISKCWDKLNSTEYIEMWGLFEDGSIFMMRSPLESIRDTVKIFNRFLIGTGGIVTILGSLIAWYFSKRLSDPILQLSELSKKMANLDFEAKYSGSHSEEIDVLGNNFNAMSEKLESTISNLKSANNKLLKDIEKKEQMEQMQQEFLANVSHELKTPIALVQGYAEGLKEGVNNDPESLEFYCDVIIDEAGKMNQMVKNLLALNQLEFGEDHLQFERFDIVELIRGVLQSCEILITQAKANIIFRQEEPVYVWGDVFKVEQVVRNYFTNAIHYVDGERVIEIKIMSNEDVVRISVFNTGHPIPEEDISHIWDKFYKVDKARTREYGGNGIGLSIVKAIMNSFHKEFGVKNYDNGVEFWFELDHK